VIDEQEVKKSQKKNESFIFEILILIINFLEAPFFLWTKNFSFISKKRKILSIWIYVVIIIEIISALLITFLIVLIYPLISLESYFFFLLVFG
jgi:hypothetical protein